MSHSVVFSILIFFGSFANAFQDVKIHNEIKRVTQQMDEVPAPQRLVLLNSFLNSLDQYLRTMPIVKTPAGQQEFAGLNEFASALFPVGRMKSVNAASCAGVANKILNETGGLVSADTQEAINLVKALCR